ncbi:hypothetical protein GMA10_07185 [Kocuria koreensis]|jgi:uncharacterized protein YciI|uniref:YCII-related domain-containing protein n=1 Tax=Rothia koreensis TaxID=592378 RepID=A0A7K1LIH3_9MICC|nr:YciI family protein [Rothia koreensis]MUN54995.1 hypothetical protein [Rothia koreensis]
MAHFVVHYSYGPADQQAAHRGEHREYLGTLLEQGHLLASGPYTDDGAEGALLIFSAETADDVESLLAKDPMVVHGVVTAHEVRAWNPVLGSVG